MPPLSLKHCLKSLCWPQNVAIGFTDKASEQRQWKTINGPFLLSDLDAVKHYKWINLGCFSAVCEKMTRVLLITILLIAAILVSGCATIVTGQYQDISVTSEPSGAMVSADNGMSLTTPGNFKLERNHNYTLTAEYPGAESQQKEIKHGVQGWFYAISWWPACRLRRGPFFRQRV